MAVSSISPQSCIAYTVEILQSHTMSISTGHVIPLFCTISIDCHSRYCSLICIMSLIIQIRVQYLTDHIIKLNTMQMRSLRPSTEIDWPWQSLCRLPLKIKSAYSVQWAAVWCRKTFVARIFKIQVWWVTSAHKYGCPADGHFGQSGQWSC